MSTLEKAMDLLQILPEDEMKSVNKENESNIFESATISSFNQKSSIEKRQRGFQGLMSFAGTLSDGFDYKKELDDALDEKYTRFI